MNINIAVVEFSDIVAEILESADVISSIHCIICWLISNQSLKLVLQYNILNAKLKLKHHNTRKKNHWGNDQSSANPIPFTKAHSNALYVNISVIKAIADIYKYILWMVIAILIPERVVDPGVWDRGEL